MGTRFIIGGLVCFASCASTMAVAQSVSTSTSINDQFNRDRTVAVSQRRQPGYEPIPISAGSFNIYPQLNVSTYAVDNLYATSSNTEGDVALMVVPSITAQSTWSEHSLAVTASGRARFWADNSSENSVAANLNVVSGYDINSKLSWVNQGSYRHEVQNRTDVGALRTSTEPVTYDVFYFNSQLIYSFGRVRISGSAGAQKLAYSDVVTDPDVGAQPLIPDRSLLIYELRGEYAVSPDLALLVQGRLTDANFDDSLSAFGDRDSQRRELLAGVSFEFTDFLRGEAAVGYIDLNYDNPTFPGFDGIGGRAKLEYFPNQLTSIAFRASRTVEDSGSTISPSFVRTGIGMTVDHELYRNVIVTGGADYSENNFSDVDRSEDRKSAFLGADYSINRSLSLFGRVNYFDISRNFGLISNDAKILSANVGVSISSW